MLPAKGFGGLARVRERENSGSIKKVAPSNATESYSGDSVVNLHLVRRRARGRNGRTGKGTGQLLLYLNDTAVNVLFIR